MVSVNRWTGHEARALRLAKRMSLTAFAAHLGISERTLSTWERRGTAIGIRQHSQALLDTSLRSSPPEVHERFQEIIANDAGLSAAGQRIVPSARSELTAKPAVVAIPARRHDGTTARQDRNWTQLRLRAVAPTLTNPGSQAGRPLTAAGERAQTDEVSLLHSEDSAAGLTPGRRQTLLAPPGRFFAGLGIEVEVHAATKHDHVLLTVPDNYADGPFLLAPGCGLVIGQTDDGHAFGLDRRHARRRLRHADSGTRLPVPPAYRLDELTCALLWAVANLDQALLADDGLLAQCRDDVTGYEHLRRSSVSRDLATDLSQVGRMWLGSAFCAGHIRRHSDELHEVPVFWTRERRGEEASGWLLFTHKHDYLRATAARVDGARALRVFCIPRALVDTSPLPERILLLLAAALIESYGIEVAVTDAPEYTATAGFVTDRRTAVVANWIDADGIWHVDVTAHRPTVREYIDAVDHADHRSVIGRVSAPARLRALADYLSVDWSWLAGRCRELAAYSAAGIAQPRSRHLSVAGVDRACDFLAVCDADGTAG
jgi:hypothetical protein